MGILDQVGAALGRVLRPLHAGEKRLASRAPELAAIPRLGVTSGAFSQGERMPASSSRDGGNVSPALSWRGVPPATRELVVLCEDADSGVGAPIPEPTAHWVLYGISPDVRGLPEKASAIGTPGMNGARNVGYVGPFPPQGHGPHHYHFEVFALDAPTTLGPRASRDDVAVAMKGHVLAWGEVVGVFER